MFCYVHSPISLQQSRGSRYALVSFFPPDPKLIAVYGNEQTSVYPSDCSQLYDGVLLVVYGTPSWLLFTIAPLRYTVNHAPPSYNYNIIHEGIYYYNLKMYVYMHVYTHIYMYYT